LHEFSKNFQEAGDRFSLPNHRKLESHHSCLRKGIENSIDLKDLINSTKNDGLVTVDESRSRDCEVGWSVCESPDQKTLRNHILKRAFPVENHYHPQVKRMPF
jgi:hypothetical protein